MGNNCCTLRDNDKLEKNINDQPLEYKIDKNVVAEFLNKNQEQELKQEEPIIGQHFYSIIQ